MHGVEPLLSGGVPEVDEDALVLLLEPISKHGQIVHNTAHGFESMILFGVSAASCYKCPRSR